MKPRFSTASALIVATLLLAGCAAAATGAPSAPAAAQPAATDTPVPAAPNLADLPPVGKIWFGSAFDADTFAISHRLTTVTAHEAFSFVAHLKKAIDGSKLAIRVSWNGQLVATTAANATGTGDVWGFSPGPLFEAGTWRYDLTDIGGNVLATGTIKATP